MNNKKYTKNNRVISDNQKSTLILERRIARLEKLIKNETFDGYREIETEEDVLDLLSPSTRRMFKRLDPEYQEHALDLLSQRVDWSTEDADEIDATMRSIIRYL